jgi:hypothetical protein
VPFDTKIVLDKHKKKGMDGHLTLIKKSLQNSALLHHVKTSLLGCIMDKFVSSYVVHTLLKLSIEAVQLHA